jgi:hypothetical protein
MKRRLLQCVLQEHRCLIGETFFLKLLRNRNNSLAFTSLESDRKLQKTVRSLLIPLLYRTQSFIEVAA